MSSTISDVKLVFADSSEHLLNIVKVDASSDEQSKSIDFVSVDVCLPTS